MGKLVIEVIKSLTPAFSARKKKINGAPGQPHWCHQQEGVRALSQAEADARAQHSRAAGSCRGWGTGIFTNL